MISVAEFSNKLKLCPNFIKEQLYKLPSEHLYNLGKKQFITKEGINFLYNILPDIYLTDLHIADLWNEYATRTVNLKYLPSTKYLKEFRKSLHPVELLLLDKWDIECSC